MENSLESNLTAENNRKVDRDVYECKFYLVLIRQTVIYNGKVF